MKNYTRLGFGFLFLSFTVFFLAAATSTFFLAVSSVVLTMEKRINGYKITIQFDFCFYFLSFFI